MFCWLTTHIAYACLIFSFAVFCQSGLSQSFAVLAIVRISHILHPTSHTTYTLLTSNATKQRGSFSQKPSCGAPLRRRLLTFRIPFWITWCSWIIKEVLYLGDRCFQITVYVGNMGINMSKYQWIPELCKHQASYPRNHRTYLPAMERYYCWGVQSVDWVIVIYECYSITINPRLLE